MPTKAARGRAKKAKKSKLGQVRVFDAYPIGLIKPAPENDKVYRPVRPDDPTIEDLADSIREFGLQEPLVITKDGYLLSGHRRLAACKLAGLTAVPVRMVPFTRLEDPDRFLRLITEFNRQRTKTFDEVLREEVIGLNEEEVYEALIDHREAASAVKVSCLELAPAVKRSKISSAKIPFLNAVIKIINERRQFWPLSDRTIHYPLLNDPPLRHASKPDSRYINDKASYKDLCNLLTRARLEEYIPFEAIGDETRPFTNWDVHQDPRLFLREQLDDFGKGYWRDLMQSQPNHVEIVGEKNTLGKVLNQIAGKYRIKTTMGRGFASLDPRYKMAQRFKASGKEQLVVLIVSDHDPDGVEIATSFARSMRDDFGIENIQPIKVALTVEQIRKYRLPVGGKASAKKSTNLKKFTKKYGDDVYEVEALDPVELQKVLQQTIDSVIDIPAFNREVDAEKRDAFYLEGVRRTVGELLKEAHFEDNE